MINDYLYQYSNYLLGYVAVRITMKLLLLVLLLPLVILFPKDIISHRMIKSSNDRSLPSHGVGSSSYQDNPHCCGNCSFYSFDDLLINITNDVRINITTDMVLSSVIQLTHLKNIAIIGYNNPVVQCGYSGGLHLVSCHNFTIEGITWNECVNANATTTPGIVLYVYNSSNINFQNCAFQNSLGQLIALSEVSGSMNISNCKFTHNNHYNNHGAAIHYSSNDDAHLVFMINNCTFDYNEGDSIVYFYHCGTSQKYLLLENSTFINNKGVPVYILNQQLYINGLVLFEGNHATNGGGLFVSDHAVVILNESSVVTFSKNIANSEGGAVFVSNRSTILFEQNSIVAFNGNTASYGGAVCSKNDSNITVQGSSEITFNGNVAAKIGGAMICYNTCILLVVDNSVVTFVDNNAEKCGAIYLVNNSNIIFDDNTVIIFTTNWGGAVYSENYANIVIDGNSSVIFSSNNHVKGTGGALVIDTSACTIKGNSTVVFNSNSAMDGGVASCKSHAVFMVEGSAKVTFTNNKARWCGGALVFTDNSSITFKETSIIHFGNNSAESGGAIFSKHDCALIVDDNSIVVFNNNNAINGGAIGFVDNSIIITKGNTSVCLLIIVLQT